MTKKTKVSGLLESTYNKEALVREAIYDKAVSRLVKYKAGGCAIDTAKYITALLIGIYELEAAQKQQ